MVGDADGVDTGVPKGVALEVAMGVGNWVTTGGGV